MRNVILYHQHCPDGAMAAAITYQALKARGEELNEQWSIDLVPASYQRSLVDTVKVEQVFAADVYIVDFSFSPRETDTLAASATKVTILDHHKSAIEKFKGWLLPSNVRMVHDLNHSGAVLAWMEFHTQADYGDIVPPRIVKYVEDYDLWRHTLQDCKAVHAYLRSLDMDVMKYVELLVTSMVDIDNDWDEIDVKAWFQEEIVAEGRAILRANEQQAKVLSDKPETVVFRGLTALAVNAPLHQDDVGEMLAQSCDSGVGITWYWRDGKYKVSMRSTEKHGVVFDCSSFAMQFPNGGGHRSASSFTCVELPWRRMILEEWSRAIDAREKALAESPER